MKTKKHKFLLEPILNSELLLVNNAKKLKKNPGLLHEANLVQIEQYREEYAALDARSEAGEKGLQKLKRDCRNQLRDLSYVTYTDRDTNLFGSMIITMAERIVTRSQFSGYTFTDEMQSLGVQHILLYSHGFDPYIQSKITGQYVSAFAYLSTIIFNACIATINKFNLEQRKSKDAFLENQKHIHKAPNTSTIGPEYSAVERTIKIASIDPGGLIDKIKAITINEETQFIIPLGYKITKIDYDYILKYSYNISIKRDA